MELPKGEAEIRHQDKIMLFGSCFAENIGRRLVENKFRCDVNPYGILYNPYSIIRALTEIKECRTYTKEDLFEADGIWHSWMHHSSFSAPTAEECLANINGRIVRAHEELKQADWLLITWGTAYYYKLKETGKVVANCHKQPDRLFHRYAADVDYLSNDFGFMLEDLLRINPNLKVLFTVSPIRHAKDGMHANQLSKATLLLALEDMVEKKFEDEELMEEGFMDVELSLYKHCHYFPAYEIMLDELRDYRFYADDMLHPSTLAVDYLWECFSECCFSDGTRRTLKEWAEIRRGLEHRPFDASSEAYRNFLTQIVLKIERMKEKLPYLDVQNELELCQARLNR